MSLHEDEGLGDGDGDGDRDSEERRPAFEVDVPSKCSAWLPAVCVERVRRGMFAGRREGFGGGIVDGLELVAAALCELCCCSVR